MLPPFLSCACDEAWAHSDERPSEAAALCGIAEGAIAAGAALSVATTVVLPCASVAVPEPLYEVTEPECTAI